MRYLMILEVSQKQAYIFASTKLKDNIANSEAICKVTDAGYFEGLAKAGVLDFSKEENLVYAGGGHTVLEFASEKQAKSFAYSVSKAVRQEFHEIELFIKTMPYDEEKTPGENLEELSKQLERKKSIRQASFHQGTFGVERIQADLRKPVPMIEKEQMFDVKWDAPTEYIPSGFKPVWKLEDIGNKKQKSSFIAVVHIDGNAMGKRVEQVRAGQEGKGWDAYKTALRKFSDDIDNAFKRAYKEMADEIAEAVLAGRLGSLELENGTFPVRRIILAGDDVCFVTEGRIGIEAARIFIEKLSAIENEYGRFTACAGVAVVHQKYPFYKAYEMSELLCSNAKKYIASFQDKVEDAGAKGCAIDWHIEYGEIMDSLAQVRKMYDTNEDTDTDNGKKRLELRPYLLSGEQELMEQDPARQYSGFKMLMKQITKGIQEESIAKGKLKELRSALKEGEKSAKYYMESHLMDDLLLLPYEGREINTDGIGRGKGMERKIFVQTADGEIRSLLFDAIELVDTFIDLDE